MHSHFTFHSNSLEQQITILCTFLPPFGPLRDPYGGDMAAPMLWHVHFAGVGAEGSPEALNLCPLPLAGQEGSRMPTFHQHLVLFSFPIASSLTCIK